MKKKLIVISVLITIFLIISMILILNISTGKQVNEENDYIVKNTYYNCEGKSYKNEDYIIYNNQFYHFENGKIVFGTIIQTYSFYKKNKYDNFTIKENDYFNPVLIEKDDDKMSITYTFSHYKNQEDNQTEKEYIKKIEKNGFKCNLKK